MNILDKEDINSADLIFNIEKSKLWMVSLSIKNQDKILFMESSEESAEHALFKLYNRARVKYTMACDIAQYQYSSTVLALLYKYINYDRELENLFCHDKNSVINSLLPLKKSRGAWQSPEDDIYADEGAINAYGNFRYYATHQAIEIVSDLLKFSENEKIEILISNEKIYKNILNAESIVDIFTRKMLYGFIPEKTVKIKQAYDRHINRINFELDLFL